MAKKAVKPLRANARQRMGGLAMLRRLKSASASLVIFDPQYRQGLDRLKYGNEGQGRQAARFAMPAMNDALISAFIVQIERVLKPSGHLFLWMDKYALLTGFWQRWVPEVTPLTDVDGIVWEKHKIGMGYRSRLKFEFLLVLQKGPRRASGIWIDRGIPDVWKERAPPGHPHAKPAALTKRLIECVTKAGDLVVDPAAGGYGVLDICRQTGRTFVGCDLIGPDDGEAARRRARRTSK